MIFESGSIDEAEEHFDAALAEFRALQNAYGEAAVLTNLAKVARARADYQRSIELFQKGLSLRWTHGDHRASLAACAGWLRRSLSSEVRAGNTAVRGLRKAETLDRLAAREITIVLLGGARACPRPFGTGQFRAILDRGTIGGS